jgi:hypothetical protein
MQPLDEAGSWEEQKAVQSERITKKKKKNPLLLRKRVNLDPTVIQEEG